MYRIFISHSSVELREAQTLKDWLVHQDPPLANEIFLDADMMPPGLQWKHQLKQAMKNCEAVICLTSKSWAARPKCLADLRTAEHLNKRMLCARLEPADADEATSTWQSVDLWGEPQTETPLDDHKRPIAFSTLGSRSSKRRLSRRASAPNSSVWPPPDEPDRAPYRGWEPLEEIDAAVYFGDFDTESTSGG